MPRITCIVLIALLVIPCISDAGTIDVQIKGIDDGVKTTKQQDYKEAVLFAKRAGQFVAYDNGTVKDTMTGLMWASKDNGENIDWKDAKRYCENYRGGGYTDWRMPTIDELAGLYDENESYQAKQRIYDVHLTKLIQLTACCPWASETRGFEAAVFGFYDGGRGWFNQLYSSDGRALPVRGGN